MGLSYVDEAGFSGRSKQPWNFVAIISPLLQGKVLKCAAVTKDI